MRESLTIIRRGVTAFAVLMAFVVVLLANRPVTVSQSHEGDFPTTGPSNAAVWTPALAKRFPNCRNIDNRPKNVIPNEVVLVPLDGGKAYREQFATAWANRNDGQNFTVGYCE